MANPWSGSGDGGMIVTTTPVVEGKPVKEYLGIVAGEVIVGANMFRDLFASITDIVGGRSGKYEEVLSRARNQAICEMKAKRSNWRQCGDRGRSRLRSVGPERIDADGQRQRNGSDPVTPLSNWRSPDVGAVALIASPV